MRYLNAIIEKKGWNASRRDEEVMKVLGYKRPYDTISKGEASRILDEWKK